MSNKEFPKYIYTDRLCINCIYYESKDWNPNWGERWCHHPDIIRTGLINTSYGCEKYKKKERKKK